MKQPLTPDYIFESSWEVCNKVGGIYTVLSTRAKTLKDAFNDKIIFIGPDFWEEKENPLFIEDSSIFDAWSKSAKENDGLQIRVGRWNIPGEPIAILVDFNPFFAQKNEIYAKAWEYFQVDSLHAYGDYDEASMFSYAAAKVLESFYNFYIKADEKVVYQAHEWMTGLGALYIQKNVPQSTGRGCSQVRSQVKTVHVIPGSHWKNNRWEPELKFPAAETVRLKGRKKIMSKFAKISAVLGDLDAIMITSEPGRLYATGFPASDGMAIVTREESYFFTDSRYIEAAQKKVNGCKILQFSREHPMTDLANEVIQSKGITRMGFEEEYCTVSEYENWKEQLHCELVPGTHIMIKARSSKDPDELENLIQAQRISEGALQEVLNFIKVGRTEREIAAYLQYCQLIGGGEKMAFEPIVVSGKNSSMPHGVPTDKPVEAGDFITMDFGCVYNGYCSDMTRTVAVGYVTEEMEKVYNIVRNAQKAGMNVAKAGVTGAQIHAAGAKVIADAGYGAYFGHGFGHGVGVELHEHPFAGPVSHVALPVHSVISAEPGIYIPGKFGVRIEDVVIIEENGCTDINHAPKDLVIL